VHIVIEFISVFPETALEISFTVPSGLVHSDQCSAAHSHFMCLHVLCSAICGLMKDKQIGEVVKESDDLYESGL
jgi:hypothetical protein